MSLSIKNLFSKKINILIIYSVIVLAVSYFTYFKNYDYPPSVFGTKIITSPRRKNTCKK